jgi:two-component system, OmpR family, sensor histidine kinase KdpD
MSRPGHQVVRLIAAFALVGAVGSALLPLRNADDAIAIGILLAVPLAAAAAIGGPYVGVLTAVATFFYYDYVFVPPYGKATIAEAKNAIPLALYGLVALGCGVLVTSRRRSRATDRRRALESQLLVRMIGSLATNEPLDDLLSELVNSVRATFGLDGVELLLVTDAGFERAAGAGSPIDDSDLNLVAPSGGSPRSLGAIDVEGRRVLGIPLAASGQAIGLLVCAGPGIPDEEMGALRAYASQAAFAIERARLRERALESALLRQVGSWRGALLGAVSHDLRTPLASVKAAVSDLRNDAIELSEADRAELLELVETQADRLDRLVANLLDMTRIEFGELELRMDPTPVDKLVAEALDAFGSATWIDRVSVFVPKDVPAVFADHVLICQVLVNLLENAERHAPVGTTIDVIACRNGERVEVAVEDRGPGIPVNDRERVFKMFNRISGGGRAGLGLAIVDAFVAAHGGSARVEERAGGGARFVFTLPVAEI